MSACCFDFNIENKGKKERNLKSKVCKTYFVSSFPSSFLNYSIKPSFKFLSKAWTCSRQFSTFPLFYPTSEPLQTGLSPLSCTERQQGSWSHGSHGKSGRRWYNAIGRYLTVSFLKAKSCAFFLFFSQPF